MALRIEYKTILCLFKRQRVIRVPLSLQGPHVWGRIALCRGPHRWEHINPHVSQPLPASAKVHRHANDPVPSLDAWRKRSAYMKIWLLPLYQSGLNIAFLAPSGRLTVSSLWHQSLASRGRQGYRSCYWPDELSIDFPRNLVVFQVKNRVLPIWSSTVSAKINSKH